MANTLEEIISRKEYETQTDYIYRLLGSAEEWLPLVKNTSILEDTVKAIFKMYHRIKIMPTNQLADEWQDTYYSNDRKREDIVGAYCRTWCRLARNELDFRDGCDPEDDDIIDEDAFMKIWNNTPGINIQKTETGGFILSLE